MPLNTLTPSPTFRDFDGWLNVPLFNEKHFLTTRTKTDELWQFLRSYSAVKSRGKQLVVAYNVPLEKRRVTLEKFTSFIAQAENYWRASEKLSFKSSPLLYYFSFLNLVKAYLILEDPDMPDRIGHGLAWNSKASKSLDRLSLSVKQSGNNVFYKYHHKVFNGVGLPSNIDLKKLFSYLPANSMEFEDLSLGKCNVQPVIARMIVSQSNQKFWPAFAVPKNAFLRRHSRSFPLLRTKYEFCDISQNTRNIELIKTVFNLPAAEWMNYDFFQANEANQKQMVGGNSVVPMMIALDFKDLFSNFISHNNRTGSLYSTRSAFLAIPYSPRSVFRLNEEVAAYAVMYFMSELVRYRPDFLDKLLGDRLLWLFESYVNSYPLIFLNHISSRIVRGHLKVETDG